MRTFVLEPVNYRHTRLQSPLTNRIINRITGFIFTARHSSKSLCCLSYRRFCILTDVCAFIQAFAFYYRLHFLFYCLPSLPECANLFLSWPEGINFVIFPFVVANKPFMSCLFLWTGFSEQQNRLLIYCRSFVRIAFFNNSPPSSGKPEKAALLKQSPWKKKAGKPAFLQTKSIFDSVQLLFSHCQTTAHLP